MSQGRLGCVDRQYVLAKQDRDETVHASVHGRVRSQCKDCGGSALCEHGLLAKANCHFAQEATLIYILEFSLCETYAQSKFLTNLLQYASRVWGGATQSIRVNYFFTPREIKFYR